MKMFSSIFGLGICCVASLVPLSDLCAQSTHDLEPPTQAKTNTRDMIMSADPNAIPTFTFAVVSLKDGNVEIASSEAKQEKLAPAKPRAPKGMVSYTENVTQNYTIQVPYTENVNGKPIQRIRTETRTRTVPVTRFRKAKAGELPEGNDDDDDEEEVSDAPVTKTVQIEYEVSIPFTEVVDGKNTTKVRTETRTSAVNVTRGKVKTESKIKADSVPIAEAKFYSVIGEKIEPAEFKKRLAEKAAVIVIKDKSAITPYFESILKENVMFLVRPIEDR